VRIDARWFGDDINRTRAELVGLQPDIIVASTTPATVAVRRETRTIPIVFANVSDPVANSVGPGSTAALDADGQELEPCHAFPGP
jgi:putative ABC transport system substrate-binding protein